MNRRVSLREASEYLTQVGPSPKERRSGKKRLLDYLKVGTDLVAYIEVPTSRRQTFVVPEVFWHDVEPKSFFTALKYGSETDGTFKIPISAVAQAFMDFCLTLPEEEKMTELMAGLEIASKRFEVWLSEEDYQKFLDRLHSKGHHVPSKAKIGKPTSSDWKTLFGAAIRKMDGLGPELNAKEFARQLISTLSRPIDLDVSTLQKAILDSREKKI